MRIGRLLLPTVLLGAVNAELTEIREGTCAQRGYQDLTPDQCSDAADKLGLQSNVDAQGNSSPGGCVKHDDRLVWTDNPEIPEGVPQPSTTLFCEAPDGFMATGSPGIPELPSVVELPYKSGIVNGTGYHHKEAHWAANPFDPDQEVPSTSEEGDLEYNFASKIATSQEDFSSTMRATANVDGHGWGVKAQVSFAMDRMNTFSASEVLFIMHIDKDFGFTGWKYAPNFTEDAKKLLCNGSDLNQQAFEDTYGTYYVVGANLGTVLDLYVSATSDVTSSSQRIDSSLSMSWDSAGKGIHGDASFATALNDTKSLSNVRIWAHTTGIPKDWTPTPTLDTINVTVDEYKTRSSVGGGVTLRLWRYADHPDYIKTVQDCKSNLPSVSVSEFYLQQLTDLVVEAKLMSQDMLHRNPTDCVYELFNQTEAIIDQYSNLNMVHVNFPVVTQAGMAVSNIKNQWEPVSNKCLKNVKMCHCSDKNDPHFAKNGYVCDGDTADTSPRWCAENEVCYADGNFRLDEVQSEGCKKVPMCTCQHPNGLGDNGPIGMNGWSCDDGKGGWCEAWQECYTTSSWKRGAEQDEGCHNAKVCQCTGGRQFDCWEETGGDRKPIYDPDHTACAGDEKCWNSNEWNYGVWSEGCARDEDLFAARPYSNCAKSDQAFKGKPVKLVAQDPEECYSKCKANENIKLCKGWAWKASSKKPCRLYKKNKVTKAKVGIVMGKKNCHPYEGKVEKEN